MTAPVPTLADSPSPEIRIRKMMERILHIDDQIAVSRDQQALIEHEIEQTIWAGLTECPKCDGDGWYWEYIGDEDRHRPSIIKCPECGGLGVIG